MHRFTYILVMSCGDKIEVFSDLEPDDFINRLHTIRTRKTHITHTEGKVEDGKLSMTGSESDVSYQSPFAMHIEGDWSTEVEVPPYEPLKIVNLDQICYVSIKENNATNTSPKKLYID